MHRVVWGQDMVLLDTWMSRTTSDDSWKEVGGLLGGEMVRLMIAMMETAKAEERVFHLASRGFGRSQFLAFERVVQSEKEKEPLIRDGQSLGIKLNQAGSQQARKRVRRTSSRRRCLPFFLKQTQGSTEGVNGSLRRVRVVTASIF